MATCQQNIEFQDRLFPKYPLDVALDWIAANLEPHDVFDSEQIAQDAAAYIEIDDVYSDSDILGYISETWTPEDVFEDWQLAAWAENNGYTKESQE